jgi:hypothetical protein
MTSMAAAIESAAAGMPSIGNWALPAGAVREA